MAALASALKENSLAELWRTYTAEILWSIARGLYNDYPMPSYCELIQSGRQGEDRRTAQEIKADVLSRLGV